MKRRSLAEIQDALGKIVADLSEVENRLALLSEHLPEPTGTFNVRAQLRNALDCVRLELLADAIETLDVAARMTPERFLADYRERLQRLGGGLW